MNNLAERFHMPVLDKVPSPKVPSEILERLPYAFVKRQSILPIALEGERIVAAVSDPLNVEGVEELALLLGLPIDTVYCPSELLMVAIQETFGSGKPIADMEREEEEGGESEVYDLLETNDLPPIIRLLNHILSQAIQQGASDIHFEPLENDLRVRYRIDGVLQIRHAPPRDNQAQLLARIKVMARLDIAEHRLPQDGRIKLRMGGREIDFRVSTVPVNTGERIVLRILDKGNVILGLDKLGLDDELLKKLRRMTSMPEGIVLVTGPTGSGKTTTLYSALSEISTDEVNIMTVEDPVEYKLPGIAQIGVRPKIGLTFAAGLRHILRQDPDVVMVGEIRDQETAEIAIQASLTGHLVLSTLHTNDAPSALTRLVDMGIEPYLLSSSVVGILAQRLVRTICSACQGDGCETCAGSGYKGRRSIYELMEMTPRVKQQILSSGDAVALRRIAIEEGMESLAQNGQRLVEAGVTTIAEVLRVTRGVSEE